MVWYSHLFKDSPQFIVTNTVKGFSVVNDVEVVVFLESPYFLYDPTNVGNLISGSSSFSKPRQNIWKFMVHVLLKFLVQVQLEPGLENFEHYFTSV